MSVPLGDLPADLMEDKCNIYLSQIWWLGKLSASYLFFSDFCNCQNPTSTSFNCCRMLNVVKVKWEINSQVMIGKSKIRVNFASGITNLGSSNVPRDASTLVPYFEIDICSVGCKRVFSPCGVQKKRSLCIWRWASNRKFSIHDNYAPFCLWQQWIYGGGDLFTEFQMSWPCESTNLCKPLLARF